jgi:hypothetical protein
MARGKQKATKCVSVRDKQMGSIVPPYLMQYSVTSVLLCVPQCSLRWVSAPETGALGCYSGDYYYHYHRRTRDQEEKKNGGRIFFLKIKSRRTVPHPVGTGGKALPHQDAGATATEAFPGHPLTNRG